MTQAKHTPAPWETSGIINNTIDIITVSHADRFNGGKVICNLSAYEHRNVSIEEVNANARLIASAPELLESLKAISIMLADLEGCRELTSYEYGCLEIATKAITKATSI